jgi:hypothetical protein
MVSDSELRKGNLFNPAGTREIPIPQTGIIFKILELKADKVSAILVDEHPARTKRWLEFNYNEICPIRLTTKILEKCGFDYIDNYTCMVGIWVFKWSAGGTALTFEYAQDNIPKYRQVPIIYLHELQNLYFALTGEELNISL